MRTPLTGAAAGRSHLLAAHLVSVWQRHRAACSGCHLCDLTGSPATCHNSAAHPPKIPNEPSV